MIFSAASCHEKDTESFIGRDLLTPSLARERERERPRVRMREREGAFFHFISYINVHVLVSRI